MLKIRFIFAAIIFCSYAQLAQAEPARDCLLEGNIEKTGVIGEEKIRVKIHRIGQYSKSTPCRIRRDKKMEFRLPDDPRLWEATDGSEVQYRYRNDQTGGSSVELINIAT